MTALPVDPSPLVRFDRVDFAYDREPVLSGISWSIDADDFVGIVGPSGSGKTTMLRLLLGTVAPTAGEVFRVHGLKVGYVPQVETVDWNFPVTVAEAVVMARPQRRFWPRTTAAERSDVADVLGRLGIGDLADRHIRQLSGGQQQRVFVARALLRRPDLLVLDEPTSGVDVRTRHEVMHLLGELQAGGLAVVLTTHDLNGIAAHLPKLVCLNQRIVAEGSPLDVLTPANLEATYGAPMEILEHGGMPIVVDRAIDRHREIS